MSRGLIALVSALILALTFEYFKDVDQPFLAERLPRHDAIVHGQAQVPYRYRVLVPALTEAGMRVAQPVLGRERAFLAVYLLYDACAFAVTLLGLWLLLRALGHSPAEAFAGLALLAALLPVTFRSQWFQPWSILEPGLLALGLLAAWRGWSRRLLLLVLAACLARETGIYVALGAVLVRPRSGAAWLALALGVLVLGGLRLALGDAPPEITLDALRVRNFEGANLRAAALGVVLVAGACLVLAAVGLRRADRDFRRAAWLVPVHGALVAVFGVWVEARLWIIVLPVLLPLAWAAVFPPAPGARTAR